MKAFHDNQAIKDEYLARVRAHAAADEIIKGQYWEGGRGCAVGCTIHSDEHKDYERLLGIPVELALLEDDLFENLPLAKAKLWPELFLNSINVGADLSLVFSKFVVRILGDSERGCIIHAKTPEAQAAINSVISLYKRKLEGDVISDDEWTIAQRAVFAAPICDATFAAAYAATTWVHAANHAAAFAAAAATATDAINAVIDAYTNTATSEARVRHYEWMSDVLIEELKNASVS